jgi:hypothetical protein
MPKNEKLEKLLDQPIEKWIDGLEIAPSDLGEYSPHGYTYLSEIIRAKKLPLLARKAPEAIQDPALWLKPNKPTWKAASGGNSIHEAAGVGHMEFVPEKILTAPNLLTVDRWTMNVFHISARRGELHHLPEKLRTKENMMTHTVDYCTAYLFSASEGNPEQIPKDHWTDESLFFATQNGLSTMAVLRDRGKMHLLLGLDFDEKHKIHFGDWWEENEEYKKKRRNVGADKESEIKEVDLF